MAALQTGRTTVQSFAEAQSSHLPALTPVLTQAPARHCEVFTQVPAPAGRPQRLSLASQAPLSQARAASIAEQGSPGRAPPLATLGAQVPGVVKVLHHRPPAQSPSKEQLVPHDPSVVLQNGALAGQARVAALAALPLHGRQVLLAESHRGLFEGQSRAVAQSSHFPVLAPAVMQIPLRHWPLFVQGPSPPARPQWLSPPSQAPATHARVPSPGVQVPPGRVPPLAILGAQVPGVVKVLHHRPPAQSPSKEQLVPHEPTVVLQNGAATGQACAAPLPALPVQGRHAFVVRLHRGAVPGQSLSRTQAAHLPVLAPVDGQTPVRHCAVPVQVPSPGARPQRLSVASHAPLAQALTASTGVQVPPGTGSPLSTLGAQVRGVVKVLHQRPPVQSPSMRQLVPHEPRLMLQKGVATGQACVAPPVALPLHATQRFVAPSHRGVLPAQFASVAHSSHLLAFAPAVMQTPVRHCAVAVQVPSPGARPQRLSAGSQVPLAQARVASWAVQTPPGSGSPLSSRGAQVPGVVKALHQRPALQSLSDRQLVPHEPRLMLQKGAPAGQTWLAALPALPLQAAHVLLGKSHRGVPPEQFESLAHSPHLPTLGPVVGQMPVRHWVLVAHVPSPGARPQRLSAASHAPLSQMRVATTALQAPPGTGSPLLTLGAQVAGVVKVLHQRPPAQSASPRQLVPHEPRATLQKGIAAPQGRVAVPPALPLQPTQVAASQMGVLPEQSALPVQPTHRLVVVLQTGVEPAQVVLPTHSTHLPALGPVDAQALLRQGVPVMQGPSPVAKPQRLSAVSQVPVVQARAPRPAVHVPPGTGCPFTVVGVQVPAPVTLSHQKPAAQSASRRQLLPHAPVVMLQNGAPVGHASAVPPPALPEQGAQVVVVRLQIGVAPLQFVLLAHPTHRLVVDWQMGVEPPQLSSVLQAPHLLALVPLVTQTPVRHCASALQVPSPGARPQALSVASQAPETQARPAIVGVQVPPGMGWPLPVFGPQVPAPVTLSHQLPAPQSLSCRQVPLHAPVPVLQKGAGPVHDRAEPEPRLPLQATQMLPAKSHSGVVPAQVPSLTQATQRFVVVLHAGVAPPQLALVTHSPHLPALAPLVTQTPVRHWASAAQVPSPGARPQRLSTVSQAPVVQARAARTAVQDPPGTV